MLEGKMTFELSGCYRRYRPPLCRSVFLGTPTDDMRRAEVAQMEGIEAGIHAAQAAIARQHRKGVLGYADKARNGAVRAHGVSVGLSYPPDWGERTASIRQKTNILQRGMVFHFMRRCGWTAGALRPPKPF